MYFWNKTLHVSDSSFVHHQDDSCQQTRMKYTTAVCAVKKPLMMERGTVRNM